MYKSQSPSLNTSLQSLFKSPLIIPVIWIYHRSDHVPQRQLHVSCHASFHEMFQLQYETVLQHSLLQSAGAEGEVHSPL
jgi:hypothetical protein